MAQSKGLKNDPINIGNPILSRFYFDVYQAYVLLTLYSRDLFCKEFKGRNRNFF